MNRFIRAKLIQEMTSSDVHASSNVHDVVSTSISSISTASSETKMPESNYDTEIRKDLLEEVILEVHSAETENEEKSSLDTELPSEEVKENNDFSTKKKVGFRGKMT